MSRKGNVFNIQRYTLHDGPGLRTELFLKGCPLRCSWCSNPESWSVRTELGAYTSKCISREKCGLCESICSSSEVLHFENNKLNAIDSKKLKILKNMQRHVHQMRSSNGER